MPYTLWSGSISFGLVNVPVKMHSSKSDKKIRFNRLNPETGNRLRQKLVDEVTGEEVQQGAANRGFDLGGGRYVVVTDEDMQAVAGKRSETIEVELFVPAGDVDQMLVETTHYLAAGKGGARAYALLSSAMRSSGRVAVGRLCLRSQERVVVIRPLDDGVLVADSLAYHDCFNDDAGMQPDTSLTSQREVDMGVKLIESMAGPFVHSSYRDEYRASLERLIEARADGADVPALEPVRAAEPTVDLMEALEASLSELRPDAVGVEDAQVTR